MARYRWRGSRIAGGVFLLWIYVACGTRKPENETEPQWYHLQIVTDSGDAIPFFLRLPRDCTTELASIVNGAETLEAGCERSQTGFRLDFPVYGTALRARVEPSGMVTGNWGSDGEISWQRTLQLKGYPVSEPDPRSRFSLEPDSESAEREPSPEDVSGTWKMRFNLHGEAKGVFSQEASGVVTGTVEIPSEYGDLRFLAGNLRGDRMFLSTFDGGHAMLVHGQLREDGTMAGEWVVGGRGWDPFQAARDASFEMPDPLARVRVHEREARLDIEALRDAKYEGKAVIVEILGTWCPNCNDLAPLLSELHRRYVGDGLEILGLAFEFGDDRAYKEERVEEFKRKHGAGWDVVIMDVSLEELGEALPGIARIEGVPATLFLNRDGTLHALYAGFSGPATGDSYLEARAQFERLTAEILRSE